MTGQARWSTGILRFNGLRNLGQTTRLSHSQQQKKKKKKEKKEEKRKKREPAE